VEVQPGLPRYLEVCGENTGRRDDEGRDRQPVGEEEDAAPVDAERRDGGDQKGQGVAAPAPLVSGRAFRPQHDQSADGKGEQARDEMHPSEREEVEIHNRVPAVLSAVQLLPEKRDDRGVEVAMKGGPIEPRRVLADLRGPLREGSTARRDKVEMAGARHKMQLRW
jgi:hypothetical protein